MGPMKSLGFSNYFSILFAFAFLERFQVVTNQYHLTTT